MGKITEEMPMNITVYLGANEGSDPALKQAVEELGRWIGESGNALVYGGVEVCEIERCEIWPDGASGPQRSDGGR